MSGGHPIHGHTGKGVRPSPTYSSWSHMRQRCRNPRYKHYSYYGGRGITICPEWDDFRVFLSDMGERPEGKTLDRIDPDGNYEPSNCRWATHAEQQANHRPHTMCQAGLHEWIDDNLYLNPNGNKECRICARARRHADRARLAEYARERRHRLAKERRQVAVGSV